MALVACGSKKSDSSLASQYFNGNYYSGNYLTSTNDAGYLADNFQYKNTAISNSTAFRNFLNKALGVCDMNYSTGGTYSCDSWISGYFRVILQAQSTVAQVQHVIFMAYPQNTYGYSYGYSMPSWSDFFVNFMGFPVPNQYQGATRNPLAIDLTVSLINNSQGFEGRAYGAIDTLANKSLIQLQVPTGKVLDNSLAYVLSFEGQQFASGTFYRCTYPNCQ